MIEHKNTILAIVLSLIVVVGWQFFVGYPQMEKQRQRGAAQAAGAGAAPARRKQPGAALPATRRHNRRRAPPVPGGSAAAVGAIGRATPRCGCHGIATHVRSRPRRLTAASTSRAPASTTSRSSNTARRSIPIRRRSCCSRRRARRTPITRSSAGCRRPARPQKMPGPDTVWTQEGSGALTAGHPVTLSYDNGDGLDLPPHHRGRRPLSVHAQGRSAEQGQRAVTLFPYALISRHGTPQGAGLLHPARGPHRRDGRSGRAGGDLQEDARQEEAAVGRGQRLARLHRQILGGGAVARHRRQGACALLCRRDRRPEDLPDRLSPRPKTIAPGATASANARLFAGAKEVSVVGINFPLANAGGYNQALNLNHFDLLDRLGLVLLPHQADVPGASTSSSIWSAISASPS